MWYDHQPEKWLEFKRRYFAELDERPEFVKKVVMLAQKVDRSVKCQAFVPVRREPGGQVLCCRGCVGFGEIKSQGSGRVIHN